MQDREPPAYQEYAAAMLARLDFRLLTLTERGLLYTLRQECWVNNSMPSDSTELAQILGLNAVAIADSLPKLKSFFTIENGKIRCPELDDYKAHLKDRHLRQSDGAKTARANDKTKKPKEGKGFKNRVVTDNVDGKASNPQAPYKHPASNLQGLSTTQPSTTKSNPSLVRDLPSADTWMDDYNKTSVNSAEAYRKASRG